MNMRKASFSILAAGLALLPAVSFAATGFIDSPMWIFPADPAQNQTVTLYALFRNEENSSITGTVLFYDKDTLVGKKKVTIVPGGVGTASTSFRISSGNHPFSATMSSLSSTSSSGNSSTLILPLQSAEMPPVVVKETVVARASTANASSSSASDPTSSAVLGQVDNLQTAALSVVPVSFQSKVTAAVQSLDAWRDTTANSFADSKAQAQKETSGTDASASKNTKVSASTAKASSGVKYIDGPLAYLKLVLFSILSFVFSFPVIFYIVGVSLLYAVIRFIVRKVVNGVRNRRYHSV